MLTTKVTGQDVIPELLARLGSTFSPKQAEEDLLAAAQPMADAARANVPLGPPALHIKENIGVAPVPGKPGRVAVGALRVPKIGELFYGRFLEFGTVKQSATPWLRPAGDATRGAVLSGLISRIRARVRAAVGR